MKNLGLIGCLNDTMQDAYLRTLGDEFKKAYGEYHTAQLNISFIDAVTIEDYLVADDWVGAAEHLIETTKCFTTAKLDAVLLCESVLDPLAYLLHQGLEIECISMSQAVLQQLRRRAITKVALLGIQYAQEDHAWNQAMQGITVLQPTPDERAWLNDCIRKAASGEEILSAWTIEIGRILSSLQRQGAQAAVIVARPIHDFLPPSSETMRCFDAAHIHAWATANWAYAKEMLPAPPCFAVHTAIVRHQAPPRGNKPRTRTKR